MTCSERVFHVAMHALRLDQLRTLWFIWQLKRLLHKYDFSQDEVDDVVRFALTVRHLEAMA